ncbi:MAG: HlyC/CorC family transporter [Victivallales bacterium]|nr:HlyC/CorC family transporter [Victivallales bacterium]
MSLHAVALLAGILILLFLSGFFSSSETALLSLSRTDVKRMSGGCKEERLVFRLLKQPQRLLSTILVGNMFVNVLMAALFSVFLQQGMEEGGGGLLESMLSKAMPGMAADAIQQAGQVARTLLNIVIVTPLLMIFGEQTPKVLAYSNAPQISRKAAPLLSSLRTLFAPITWMLRILCDLVLRLIGQKPVGPWKEITAEELISSISVSQETGATDGNEYNMLARIVELSSIDVKEIMTHRMEVVGISDKATLREAFSFAKNRRHSWYPVFNGSIDNIWGMFSLVDILHWRGRDELDLPLAFFRDSLETGGKGLPVSPASFVPRTLPIDKLLISMREKAVSFAVVVDEYGGTAGIITMNDVIEEFVGRFASGEEDEDAIHYRKDGVITCDGRAHLRALQKRLGDAFDIEDCVADTIGGLIMEMERVIPRAGTSVKLADGTRIVVKRMSGRRVRSVEILLPEVKTENGQGDGEAVENGKSEKHEVEA